MNAYEVDDGLGLGDTVRCKYDREEGKCCMVVERPGAVNCPCFWGIGSLLDEICRLRASSSTRSSE